MKIAIVGAGIAGLSCADALAGAHTVTLFDKGRAPGGRMSTRRQATAQGEAQFDHGAQYFTVRDPAFRAQVDRWHQAGLAAPWTAAGPDAWVGTPAMTAPVRAMATRHDTRFPIEVTALERHAGGWRIDGDEFDAVILALPAENVARLLAPSNYPFATLAAETPSAPCWTVMAVFAEPLPAADILRQDAATSAPIGWAARNSAKPGRTGPESWVIQAGPDWSRANLEQEKEAIVPLLLDALAARIGAALPTPVATSAHRWRYARAGTHPAGAPKSLWDPASRLGLCGDWLFGPRVEAAWCSGAHLAAAITRPPASDLDTPPQRTILSSERCNGFR